MTQLYNNTPRYDEHPPMTVTRSADVRATPQHVPSKPPPPAQIQACLAATAEQSRIIAEADKLFNEGRGSLTRQGYIDMKASIKNTEAARLLDLINERDAAQAAKARQEYQASIAALRTEGDTADELRRTRFAAKAEQKLQAAANAATKVAVAEEMVKAATKSELSVLLENDEIRTASWLPGVLEQVDPEIAAKAAEAQRLSQLATITGQAVGAAQRGMQNGVPTPKVVFDKLAPLYERYDRP